MTDVIANRYELIREVGRGGMGAVWFGRDRVLGREVAIKQLAPVEAGGATTSRAAREAQLAARLNHRNVVAVFDLVEQDGRPWLVMEYVPGTTLSGLVAERGPLSPDAAAQILSRVADALEAAHQAGVVHRDVKPSNILVAPDGQVKLTDFGIARGTGADMTLTATGLVTGSPAYLSPEVASGQSATPASDVWGLGATLYFAVTGRAPYEVGDNVLGALYRIVHEEPPRTSRAGRLAPVLAGAMTRDPAQRWTMTRVHESLASSGEATQPLAADDVPAPPERRPAPVGTAPMPPPVRPPVGPPPASAPVQPQRSAIAPTPRRRRILLPAAIALLLVLAAAGGLALALGGGDQDAARPTAGESSAADGGEQTSGSSSGGADPDSDSSGTGSPDPSDTSSASEPSQGEAPTAAGVRAFVTDYLNTASSNPEAGFGMLTPGFQAASGGYDGYETFWGEVASIDRIAWIKPRVGDRLGASYQYTYTMDAGDSHTQRVSLSLAYEDGTYLVAGED